MVKGKAKDNTNGADFIDEMDHAEHKKAKKNGKKSSNAAIIWTVVVLVILLALVIYNREAIFGDMFKSAAKVNGEKISMKQLNVQYNNLPEQYRAVLTKEQVLDRMIDFTVLKQNAEKAGYDIEDSEVDSVIRGIMGATPEADFKDQVKLQYGSYSNFKEELEDTMLVQKYAADNVEILNVTEDELSVMFEQYKSYAGMEYVRASHILVCYEGAESCTKNFTKEVAYNNAVEMRKVINDTNFAQLAQEFSSDTMSALQGGDLGWFTKGQMVPSFEDAVFSLDLNQVSDVIETQYGFHIIKVTAKRAPGNVTYEDSKPFLFFTLFTQKQQANGNAFLAFVDEQKKDAAIEKFYTEPVPEEDVIEVSSSEELAEKLAEKLAENTGDKVMTEDKKAKYLSCMKENGVDAKVVLYYAEDNEKSETMKGYLYGNEEVASVERSSAQAAALQKCFADFKKVIVPQLVCVNDGSFAYGLLDEKTANLFVSVC